MAEEYKIRLGVDLDTNDINTQISGIKPTEKIKIDIDQNYFKTQINNIKTQIQSLNNIKINLNINSGAGGNSANGASNGINRTANELTTAYNKLKNISKNIGSIKVKLNGLDTSKDVQQIKTLEAQLQSFTTKYHETVSKIKGKGDLSSNQWQSIQHQIDDTKIKLEQLSSKITDAKANLAKSIKLKIDDGTFANDISNVSNNFSKLSNQSNETRVGIEHLNQSLIEMDNAFKSGNIDKTISSYENYKKVLKDVQNQLQINAREEKNNAAAMKLADDRSFFQSKVDSWLTKNSAAAKQFGARLQELRAKAEGCDRVTLDHLERELKQIDKEAEAAGVKTQTLGDKIKSQFSKYSSYLSVATVFMYTTMAMKDMFNQVVEIDSAMTELKKVTDETDASYNQFLSNASSRAKEIGTTISGLVESTADFARLGYGFEDAQGLAEVANIYAVVGDEVEGVEGATESLISTMAAFKDEMNGVSDSDFAMGIIDRFNEIGNKFAISSGGIGEALKRSASSLNAANNTIDESIALITAANTVVQDPDRVGNAFKTISMRIRGAKTE